MVNYTGKPFFAYEKEKPEIIKAVYREREGGECKQLSLKVSLRLFFLLLECCFFTTFIKKNCSREKRWRVLKYII
jgi:hypothetical protein